MQAMPTQGSKGLKIGLITCLLAFSALSILKIPFAPYIGFDLQNIYAFQHSSSANNPYLITGAEAGDVAERGTIYPPMLYFLFSWTRLLSFNSSSIIWSIFVGLFIGLSLFFWTKKEDWSNKRKIPMLVFSVLLLAQFPSVFAIERGNTDVIILLFWSLSYYCFVNGKYFGAGAFAGISVITKIYPLFSCSVVIVAILVSFFRHPENRKAYVACLVGGGVAAICISALLFAPTLTYVQKVVPILDKIRCSLEYFSHSLRFVFYRLPDGQQVWGGRLLGFVLLGSWIIAALRYLKEDPAMIFAGALAISTYFSDLSFDYNLITTYPLLLLLFMRSLKDDSPSSTISYSLSLVGLFAVVGHRGFFMSSKGFEAFHIILQWSWLVATAWLCAWTKQTAEKA